MRGLVGGIVVALVLGAAAQAHAYEYAPSWGYAFIDDVPFNDPAAGGALMPLTQVFPRGYIRDAVLDGKDVRMTVIVFTPGNPGSQAKYSVVEGDFVSKSFDRRLDISPFQVSYLRYDFCRINPSNGAEEVCEPYYRIGRPAEQPGGGGGPPPPVDADGDGISPPTDCADNNATVWPGAADVPGNGVDENCDGRDAPGRLHATVSSSWRVTGKGARVKRLEVSEAPPGASVTVQCLNERCRFKPRSIAVTGAGTAKLTKFFRGRLRFGTVLELRVTAPNMIGKVVRYRIRRGRLPKAERLCLPVGVAKPAKC